MKAPRAWTRLALTQQVRDPSRDVATGRAVIFNTGDLPGDLNRGHVYEFT